MFCGKCGHSIPAGTRVCPLCGAVQQDISQISQSARSGSGRAKRIAAVLIITAVLLALAGSGLYFSQIYYKDSGSEQISKAETLIINGDYEEGLKLIEDINTDSAESVRQFTALLELRGSYAEAFQPDILQTSGNPLKLCYDRLREAHSAFSLADKLPGKLRKYWDRYNGRVNQMSRALTNLKTEDLTDAQLCVLKYGERKRGGSFDTTELENIIAVSEPAVKAINEKLLKDKGYREFKEASKSQAVKSVQELYDAVSAQLEQDKFDLNRYISEGREGVALSLNSTDVNYRASVGRALSPLNSESDAEENSGRLYTALCYAWMAYSYDIKS